MKNSEMVLLGVGAVMLYNWYAKSELAASVADASEAAGETVANVYESVFGPAGGGGLASNEISPAPGIIISIPRGTDVDDYMARAGWRKNWLGSWIRI